MPVSKPEGKSYLSNYKYQQRMFPLLILFFKPLKMEAEENGLSLIKSLRLITEMIETTKNSISDRSHYFLLWGWAVVTGCLTQYYLKAILNYPRHYYAWLVTPAAVILHFIFAYKDHKKDRIKTFINEANIHLWIALGLSFLALFFVFTKIGWQYYILLYAIGTFVSGSLIKFKPLVFGGLLCFALAVICVYQKYDHQILVTAFAIFISYIIPGYMLRYKYKNQKKISYE